MKHPAHYTPADYNQLVERCLRQATATEGPAGEALAEAAKVITNLSGRIYLAHKELVGRSAEQFSAIAFGGTE